MSVIVASSIDLSLALLPPDVGTSLSASLMDYTAVLSSTVIIYDWALTFGQEFELVWQRWSFMTVLCICVRYIGVVYAVVIILWCLPVPITAIECRKVYFIWIWTPIVINAILGVIMMIRILAMYQRSKKMFIFLVVALLASTTASVVVVVVANTYVVVEEWMFDFPMCIVMNATGRMILGYESLISTAIWEILAFILAVWVVIKHFRELRQAPTGSTIGDCLTVLIKSHTFYFVTFAAVTCLRLGSLSMHIMYSEAMGTTFYYAILMIAQVLQMFVLGPRLILSVRQYKSELVVRSDVGTGGMTSIYFQASGDMLIGGDV